MGGLDGEGKMKQVGKTDRNEVGDLIPRSWAGQDKVSP